MASCPGLVLRFAAIVGVATLLSAATPVEAAGNAAVAGEASTAKTVLSVVKRHTAPRVRTVASDYRRVGNPGCSVWCGRQFVLMTGIAY